MPLVISFEPLTGRPPRGQGFSQTIKFHEGGPLGEMGKFIGIARWAITAPAQDGVVQLVDLTISPAFRREGYARQLLDQVLTEARDYLRSRKSTLRRLWTAIAQKDQVIARSFLTGQGFHHISTVDNLFKDQDLLIYIRTFD